MTGAVLTSFLGTILDSKNQQIFGSLLDIGRSIFRLVSPQHPIANTLNSLLGVVSSADDNAVDAILVRKLRELRSRLSTVTMDDIQRQSIERRIAAIAAAITD